MCDTCNEFNFKGWEYVRISAHKIRVQCPKCKRFYGYLTLEEFQKQHPDKVVQNEAAEPTHNHASHR